ncbi:MAG: helix-turn-helix domain-containing protein [Planctomycetaceae bacterium]|nr:helix-turn-helix domain-containing protein [Planctomycetaceae bacterium]
MTRTNGTTAPRLLAGCEVLPAMEPPAPRPADEPSEVDARKATGKTTKRKAGERFAMLNTFVDFTAGTLARGELLVWLVLFRDCRDGIARTSQADIARRAGMTDRTVRRTLKRLETRGLVQTVSRGGIHRGVSKYRCHPLDRSD